MKTLREKHEADQAVDDLVAEAWIAARRSSRGDDRESLEYVIELLVLILRELARSSRLVKGFIEQRVRTMRGKRKEAA